MGSGTQNNPGLKQLITATRKITSRLDMDSVLGQIVNSLTEDLGGVCAAVWIVEEGENCSNCEVHEECIDKGRCLHLKAWSGREGAFGVKDRIPLGVMKVGMIALSRAPYLADDISQDRIVLDREWLSSTGVSSFAGFPLIHGDELLGVMAYYGDRPIASELGDMLLCLAHQSAMAIIDAERHMQVRESEERYRALIDGAIDAVLILGPDGAILAASRSATRHFGFNSEELLSMSLRDLDRASFSILKDSYAELLAGETVTYTGSFATKSGATLPVEVKAGATIYRGDTAIQAFVRDMTDRIAAEKQKADVVSMITHDLKGPLSIVLGYSEVIKEQYWDSLPDFVKEGIDSIQKGGEKLLSMVQDYLSISKMETGILVMNKYPTSVRRLIDSAMGTIMFKAEEKDLGLSVDCAEDMPDIDVDPKYMEHALTNLVMNAANYTPRGGSIRVSAGLSESGDSAVISVSDTGVGIAEDELPKIFDKYYRASNSMQKGTGLGLAIVKAVMEGHGGKVDVYSVKGKGSTFTVTVPVR